MLIEPASLSEIDGWAAVGTIPAQGELSPREVPGWLSLAEPDHDAERVRPELAGRRVVVTGGAGFIGTRLTQALAEGDARVTTVDERTIDRGAPAGVRELRADLLTADLSDLFTGVDTVFHLAGRPGVRQSWGPQFEAYVRCNLMASERVVQACAAAGVRRLVVASSSSVYGPGLGRPSRETDPTQPISPYGVSKLAAEQLCLAHALRPDVTTSVVALRYFTVYGPGQRPDMLIGRLLRAVRTGRPVPVFGTGQQSRDFTYIDDVVDLISELTGKPVPIDHASRQDGDVDATCADLTRARLRLGYVPRIGLREGLARHLAWDTAQAAGAGHPGDGRAGSTGTEGGDW